MKNSILILFYIALAISFQQVGAQGCVAVRNMSTGFNGLDSLESNSWQFSANYRYFHSYKHFVGTEEQTIRTDQGTNVINDDNSILFGTTYNLNSKWSFSAIVPILYIKRSSLYEHLGNTSGQRFTTHSQGVGDIRLMGYYNAINSSKGRLTLGLGTKLPTGDYNYQDYFTKKGTDGTNQLQLLPVDQSIQPGDGGLGLVTEINGTIKLTRNAFLYGNGLYLFNPRNTNGTVKGTSEFSSVDQYFGRLGGQVVIKDFSFGFGGRIEGIPAYDLIGGSEGFRRPGYIISAEPSIYYSFGQHTIGANVPVALVRNRTQSVLDRQKEIQTGIATHGDAAFADYLISITYSYRLSAIKPAIASKKQLNVFK
jgi:hypothetical protein